MPSKIGRPTKNALGKRDQSARRVQVHRAIQSQVRVFENQLEPFTDPLAPHTNILLSDAARLMVHSQLGGDIDITAAAVRETVSLKSIDFRIADDKSADNVRLDSSMYGVGGFFLYIF